MALRFARDPQTKEFLLSGAGQQHIEVVVAKLRKRYHVELTLHPPKVPYRETIRGKADAEGKHKKQTGGHGQFGVCRIKMEPLPRGAGIEFVDDVFGGAIPKNWIPSVEKGIRDSAERGFLAGFPVVDFRVSLYDGKYHDVDSSDMAFKIAGSLAFKEVHEAGAAGAARADHARGGLRAGSIFGRPDGPPQLAARAHQRERIARGQRGDQGAGAAMAEMLSYANELTSMTQGRGSYSMEFSHYDFVPQEIGGESDRGAQAAPRGRTRGGNGVGEAGFRSLRKARTCDAFSELERHWPSPAGPALAHFQRQAKRPEGVYST